MHSYISQGYLLLSESNKLSLSSNPLSLTRTSSLYKLAWKALYQKYILITDCNWYFENTQLLGFRDFFLKIISCLRCLEAWLRNIKILSTPCLSSLLPKFCKGFLFLFLVKRIRLHTRLSPCTRYSASLDYRYLTGADKLEWELIPEEGPTHVQRDLHSQTQRMKKKEEGR